MGKPVTGTIWYGYDNGRKKFISAEIDSGGSGMTSISGTQDEATKVVTMTGNTWGMAMNREVAMRLVLKADSDKKHTIEIYGTGPDGKEAKKVEIVYTRK